jgi:serine/threonine protein kinase
VFDVDVSDAGEPYLVMELLEGESLQNRHDRVPVDPPTLLGFVDQLLDVLAIAHDAGIVHRDIKPDNLFIDKRAGLKVLDFGIARVRHATAMIVRTKTGSALGTPSYMPPEQMTGLDVDHRADIFAVGATMFELCAGRPIHVGDNPQMLVAKIMTEQAAPLASLAPQLSPHLCAVVDRALAFDAADRYPDARTMRADVRAVQAGSPPPYASAHAPVTPTIPQEPVFEAPRAPSAMLLSERQYRIIAICLGAAFVLLMAMFLLT